MGMPEPGTKEHEDMVDFMRKDLEANMAYSKIELKARQIMTDDGRDFDEEFAKWLERRG